MIIFSDFETTSHSNLLLEGHVKYSRHPSTRPICWSLAIDDAEPFTITKPELDNDLGSNIDLAKYHLSEGIPLVVFNAEFEYGIYQWLIKRGWPDIPFFQFIDVALYMRMMNLPHRLEDAARCIAMAHGLRPYRKHFRGHQLMKKFCQASYWEDDPTLRQDYRELCEYCEQDIELTRFLYNFVPMRIKRQYHHAQLHQEINWRGIEVNVQAAESLVRLGELEKELACERMQELSYGEVEGPTKLVALKKWIEERTGVKHTSLGADIINSLLEDGEQPDDVAEMLRLRRDGGRSSTAKFQRIIDANDDGRLKGMYMYWGAGTGRASSKLVQIHNLPRERYMFEGAALASSHSVSALQEVLDMDGEGVLATLPKLIRPLFRAKDGYQLVGADFSQIEARMLAWMARQQDVLELYKAGEDVYKHTAARIFPDKEIDRELRNIGKVADLSLGYGGHRGALLGMASKYGVRLEDDQAFNIANRWRDTHEATVKYWHALMKGINRALSSPKVPVMVLGKRKIFYEFDGVHLYCQLPSGRFIVYPFVERGVDALERTEITYTWGRATAKGDSNVWPRKILKPTIAVENIIQGMCYDVLEMVLISLQDFNIVLHTHDEFAVETTATIDEVKAALKVPMPDWLKGFPLELDWWSGQVYAK
jgi:DNA polymerase